MYNGRWLKPQFDLIAEIRKRTIDTQFFNADEWSEYDAEILEKAARMIRSKIQLSRGGTPNLLKNRPFRIRFSRR